MITGGQGASGDLSSAELYNPTSKTFSTIASMTSTRYWHTATLLNTGEVLIAGGAKTVSGPDGPVPSFLATAELFNPTASSFTATGSLLAAPVRHSATLLENGRVLIGAVSPLQYYDRPTTQFYSAAGGAAGLAEDTAALLPNGQVMLAGGAGSNSFTTYIYDPNVGDLSAGGAMLAEHSNATGSSLLTGNIVIVGGAAEDFQPTAANFDGEREVDIYQSPAPVVAPVLTSVTPTILTDSAPSPSRFKAPASCQTRWPHSTTPRL